MRWPVALLVGWVFMGLEMGVRSQFAAESSNFAPSFAMVYLVFVTLFAPPHAALWTALILGLVTDIATPRGETALIVVGPYALGYLAAAYLVLTMRGLMMRRNPLALAFLCLLASVLSQIIIVFVFTLRRVYSDSYVFASLSELGERLLGSVYTALAALAVSLILFPMLPLFHFQDMHARRYSARK